MALKEVGETLDTVVRTLDRGKRHLEPGIDKALAITAANIGVVYGASEIIDSSNLSDPTNALIMMATGAALTVGNIATFSRGRGWGRRILCGANYIMDKIRPLSWLKSFVLAGAAVAGAVNMAPYAGQVTDDIAGVVEELSGAEIRDHLDSEPVVQPEVKKLIKPENPKVKKPIVPKIEKPKATIPQPGKVKLPNRPEIYDKIGYVSKVEYDFRGVKLADKYSTAGRIQRTLRWQPIYRAIEKKYGLPQDILAGMIIQESLGDPVQPNAGGDGGLGVVHVQGTTAPYWGLKIFGSSKTVSDSKHGKQISDLLRKLRYDPAKIQAYDERAHIIKVLDVAARIVTDGKRRYGTLEHGLEAYGPGKVGRNRAWRYMRDVKSWRNKIRNSKLLRKAAADFQRRNGYSLVEYLGKWHEMSDNWGLREYKKS